MTDLDIRSIWISVRNHPLLDREIPLEAVLSYPIPVERKSELLLRFFVYSTGPSEGQRLINAPFARLTTTEAGGIIEYVNRRWDDPFPGLPWEGTLGLSAARVPAEAIRDRRKTLFAHYPQVVDVYPEKPSDEQRRVIEAFRRAFFDLTAGGLIPYYQALNPAFLAWLGSEDESRADNF